MISPVSILSQRSQEWFPYDRVATAIVVIIWKPGFKVVDLTLAQKLNIPKSSTI